MPIGQYDDDPQIAEYHDPSRLVTTAWVSERLAEPGLVLVESNEDPLLYDVGHLTGAVRIDWHTELQDPVTRDYVDGAGFAALMDAKGIAREDTVVFYGDKANWWAAYALWVFTLFGHADVRLMDGGRDAWELEGRPWVRERRATAAGGTGGPGQYPVVVREDAAIRAFRDDVEAHRVAGGQLLDVRSPQEFTGERTHMPDYPQEGAMRGGHIPGARSVPWGRAVDATSGRFLPVEQLRALYQTTEGLDPDAPTVAYCRIGERSSHSWFVLTHLLGFKDVRNYDGSWTEWGNLVRAPIEKGEAAPVSLD
jgi:thiosulfate/3-mercaptopyruvate sulfurtransferase